MNAKKQHQVFLCFRIPAELKADLDRAREESGVPITTMVRMALREFLPPFETRKRLREATLAVGQRNGRKREGR
jgi:antitoxin component of RelBE/YafQ-DinJ toxin-antitoxin module